MQNNPQQTIGKPNSTTHWKDHAPWSSGIYSQGCKDINIHKSVGLRIFLKEAYMGGILSKHFHISKSTRLLQEWYVERM